MKAEIIAVGTELLLGQVVNTNATFLSEELASLGFDQYFQTVVGDNPQRLTETLTLAATRSDLVILCGGLGPTEDDLTRDVVAVHVGEELVSDEVGLEKILHHVSRSGHPMTENNKRQALTITNGTVIQNPSGLAVGTLYCHGSTSYLLLPGPPGELVPMFQQNARPLLEKMLPQKELLTSRVLRFFGIGESRLVTILAELIATQDNPTIAPYAKPSEVTLRLTAKTSDSTVAEKLLDQTESQIMTLVGEYFYGYGESNSLVAETVKALRTCQQTVTSAESLTAGLFQSTLGSVPGVSEVFAGGFVTYNNQAKHQLLGVSERLLEAQGAISEDCAIEMAKLAREKLGADYAVSLTGVAGPDKSENQEVGTVWIGISSEQGTFAKLHHFNRDRDYIRNSAVMAGLDLLRRQVILENQ